MEKTMKEKKDKKEGKAQNEPSAKDCGCSGCTGCASEACDNSCGGDPQCDYGADVAGCAIKDMKGGGPDVQSRGEEDFSKDIKSFIDKCDAEGVNPFDVVAHIAAKEGINLSGEEVPMNESNARLRRFLLAVVRKLVIALVSYIANTHGIPVSALAKLLAEGLSKVARGQDLKEDECEAAPRNWGTWSRCSSPAPEYDEDEDDDDECDCEACRPRNGISLPRGFPLRNVRLRGYIFRF